MKVIFGCTEFKHPWEVQIKRSSTRHMEITRMDLRRRDWVEIEIRVASAYRW